MPPSEAPTIGVVIATSGRRTPLLAERALPSVYAQRGVLGVVVVVVDDNEDPTEHPRLVSTVADLRARLRLEDRFPTAVVRNARTRGNSGTGAWNTGIDHLATAGATWIAVLDDDDAYLPEHLARCFSAADAATIAVFERLEWVRSSGVEPRPFARADLTPEAFFVGNPGVQGSNLFVRVQALQAIGGFDERLPNTTDRDLMIRLLRYAASAGAPVVALPSVGVRYFDHDGLRVNTDLRRKHVGLDLFYRKYAHEFDDAHLRASLDRARRYFAYERPCTS